MKFRIFLLLTLSFGANVSVANDNFPTIELDAYDGLWFEYARTPNFFEDNTPVIEGEQYSACFNSTARYNITNTGLVKVRNRCIREGQESGNVVTDTITGFAQPLPNSENAQLNLVLAPRFLAIALLNAGFGADYWIYAVGPINNFGQYEWSIVSDSSLQISFVLTRTKVVPDELRDEILTAADELGIPVDELIFGQR